MQFFFIYSNGKKRGVVC